MSVDYLTLPRQDVLASLGPLWPARVGSVLLRISTDSGVTDGAVIVRQTPGRPGVTWRLVDGVIPPQPAGPVGEELAALVPGVLETVPDPWQDASPPTDPTS